MSLIEYYNKKGVLLFYLGGEYDNIKYIREGGNWWKENDFILNISSFRMVCFMYNFFTGFWERIGRKKYRFCM